MYKKSEIAVVMLSLWLVAAGLNTARAQAGGAVAPTEARFHLVRSISGSKGTQSAGRFVVDDPRTIFYVPQDKHVIVYFEWDGPVGQHQFEGYWKNPEGKAVVISDFSYEAKQRRMAAYWELELTESTAVGMWSLEAHIDGEVAGIHSFQVMAGAKSAEMQPSRRLMEPSEIYKAALNATVTVQRITSDNTHAGTGSGFYIGDGLVLTAFQVIDGAVNLRLTLPDGTESQTDHVVAWNRLQDWAVIRTTLPGKARLARAVAGSWSVGDRCFTLDMPAEGNRVIVDENLIGTHSFPDSGERLNLPNFPTPASIGSPVLNEYGEVIGVLGGSLFPGMSTGDRRFGLNAMARIPRGSLATPISVVPAVAPEMPAKSLIDLSAANQFVTPLVKQEELLYGLLTSRIESKKGEFPTSMDAKTEFSRQDPLCTVMLVWNPRAKAKGEIGLEVFNINNQRVIHTKPTPIKLRPGTYLSSTWNVDLSPLPSGTYRVDVLQDGRPIWRSYLKLAD